MTDAVVGEVDDGNSLVPRLKVIEEQPLEQRAAAFAQIHDRLQQTLEGSDLGGARG
jgi:hypothetical protein